jgi:hypothetical protein
LLIESTPDDVRSLPVGTFRLLQPGDRWWWSDEVYAVHGLSPGDVVPTTDLLARHQHPDDRVRVLTLLDRCRRDGRAFACVTRLVDFTGTERRVLISASGRAGTADTVVGTTATGTPTTETTGTPTGQSGSLEVHGIVVDLGAAYDEAVRQGTNRQLGEALASRAVIDQAKGVLAAVRSLTPDAAFDVLRETSQRRNVRLRTLAERLVDAIGADPSDVRAAVDGLVGGPPER